MAAVPPPQEIAKGLAGAVPVELSKSPLLGILGVIMGAGIVSLMGRMLTLGLADLKGNFGIGFDDGAWINSAYNVALFSSGRSRCVVSPGSFVESAVNGGLE